MSFLAGLAAGAAPLAVVGAALTISGTWGLTRQRQ